MTGSIIPGKMLMFAAELEKAYDALVEKYWEGGAENYELDLQVTSYGQPFIKLWEEGVEFYPEVPKHE